jgi:hypothetical protein
MAFGQTDSIVTLDSMKTLSKKEIRKAKKKKKKIKVVYHDSLILFNKQVLVGEVKQLAQGVLSFKTGYSDSDFKIKWKKVAELYSDRIFIIELTSGSRLNAIMYPGKSGKKSEVAIGFGETTYPTDLHNIIYLDPIGKNFLSKMSASFDIGLTLTKANNLKQLTADAAVGYLGQKWSTNSTFSLVKSEQDNTENVDRLESSTSLQRFLPADWFIQGTLEFLKNSEQKLRLRTTGRLGIGYFFAKNNRQYFGALTGIANNREEYSDGITESNSSMEYFIGSEFNHYAIEDHSLLNSATLSPSLTEKGRLRLDFKFNMKYDLPWDFYIKTGITYNFDNQAAQGASRGDYVIQTSFGWEL